MVCHECRDSVAEWNLLFLQPLRPNCDRQSLCCSIIHLCKSVFGLHFDAVSLFLIHCYPWHSQCQCEQYLRLSQVFPDCICFWSVPSRVSASSLLNRSFTIWSMAPAIAAWNWQASSRAADASARFRMWPDMIHQLE